MSSRLLLRRHRSVSALTALIISASVVSMTPDGAQATGKSPISSSGDSNSPKDSDGDGVLESKDTVTAVAEASAANKKFEDLSQRTESVTVFANPDGSFTRKDSGGPIRVMQDGEWADVDYNLEKQPNGSWAPKASPLDVTINGGSAKEAGRVAFEDGESVAVTWPTTLPEPEVHSSTATYKVSATSDLLVTATSSGLNIRLRLNQAPAQDDPVFTFGLRTDGIDLSESKDALTLRNDDGTKLGDTARLVAWDSRVDSAGDPAHVVPLEADLNSGQTIDDISHDSLDLTPPEGFLQDPSTRYPVIIDPDIAGVGVVRDTWIRNGGSANGNDPNLIVGKINGDSNTNPGRAFIQFDTAALTGKEIISSTLYLWQYYSYTCADRQMGVIAADRAWTAGIVWADRPQGVDGTNTYVYQNNHGGPSCGDGHITANVTPTVNFWANGGLPNYGFRLMAGDETKSSSERRFCSENFSSTHNICNNAGGRPQLITTYWLTPPSPPAAPTVTTSQHSLTATTTATDPVGDQVRIKFTVTRSGTEVYAGEAAAGSPGSVTIPNLPDGTYAVRATASKVAYPGLVSESSLTRYVQVGAWLSSAEETSLRQEMTAGGYSTAQIDRAVADHAFFMTLGQSKMLGVNAEPPSTPGGSMTESELAAAGTSSATILANGDNFTTPQDGSGAAGVDGSAPDPAFLDEPLTTPVGPNAVSNPDAPGAADLENADTVDSGPSVSIAGVQTPTKTEAKRRFAYRDYHGWYVPVRKGKWNGKKGWGWDKMTAYHAINQKMVRYAVKHAHVTDFWEGGNNYVYRYPTILEKCDGILGWKSCHEVDRMYVKLLSDRVVGNIVPWDGQWRGIFNGYCEQPAPLKKCPLWVTNSENLG